MLQQFEYVVGCVRLGKSERNLFDAKTVGVGIAVGHGFQDQDDVVAVVLGAACGRFHAEAGCYSRDENLGHAALSQVLMQIRADKRARSPLVDNMIVCMLMQFSEVWGR